MLTGVRNGGAGGEVRMTIYSGRVKLLILVGMVSLSWLGAGLAVEAAMLLTR